MRLIDADKLKNILSVLEEEYKAEISQDGRTEDPFSDGILSAMFTVFGEIKKAPTVDAVPVIHAYWESYSNPYALTPGGCPYVRCSRCHGDESRHLGGTEGYIWTYCPCCGAKMDEEEKTGVS